MMTLTPTDTVDALSLSPGAADCLRHDNLIYLGDLIQKTEAEVLAMANGNHATVREIAAALAENELALGTDHIWPPADLAQLHN